MDCFYCDDVVVFGGGWVGVCVGHFGYLVVELKIGGRVWKGIESIEWVRCEVRDGSWVCSSEEIYGLGGRGRSWSSADSRQKHLFRRPLEIELSFWSAGYRVVRELSNYGGGEDLFGPRTPCR